MWVLFVELCGGGVKGGVTGMGRAKKEEDARRKEWWEKTNKQGDS